MKEDYLWDKTGRNAEIERLETTLQAFRHQENAMPDLPAKAIPFPNKPPHRVFFRWALAAGLACLAISFGVWLQLRTVTETEPIAAVAPPMIETETPAAPPSPIVAPQRIAAPLQIAKPRKIVAAATAIRQPKPTTLAKKPPVVLSKEEKYAYDQLMLALSVTTAKLKLVKDKIEGNETAVRRTER